MSDGHASAVQAPENTGGSTILTASVPPPAPAAAPAPGSADATIAAAQTENARPEWAPEKFWDAEKRTLRQEDLGKSYLNLEKLIGYEKVPVPKSDDDQEGWDRWYKATGRPDKPDDYEFKRPELPKEMGYDEDTEKSFRTWAHVNGLSKKQAQNLYDGYVKTQVERHAAYATAQKQATEKAKADLMREHGSQYDGFVTSATTAINQYGDPDFRKFLDETGLGNDPRMIRVFGRIGKEMSGETRLKGKPEMGINEADLDTAITKFRADNQAALYDKAHPGHDAAVKEFNKLFEKRFGTDPIMVRV